MSAVDNDKNLLNTSARLFLKKQVCLNTKRSMTYVYYGKWNNLSRFFSLFVKR